jgi:hypothetical protein
MGCGDGLEEGQELPVAVTRIASVGGDLTGATCRAANKVVVPWRM